MQNEKKMVRTRRFACRATIDVNRRSPVDQCALFRGNPSASLFTKLERTRRSRLVCSQIPVNGG